MVVPISKFPKEVLSQAESALKSEPFVTPIQVINPDFDFESAHADILAEMEAEWEKDWREI